MTEKKRTILGDEYDEKLRASLDRVLKKLGARKRNSDWGVAGSQEILISKFIVDGKEITIESETFMGLTVEGDPELVDKVVLATKSEMEPKR